ncbi:hypothetical protein GYMLUDRAFT_240282 [Collybiopsis luxurians FD-317 M1]|nr:hypothetical protein GYMLUDRAFT_240282 [Collybiopsis luxurians FD-317 M1]
MKSDPGKSAQHSYLSNKHDPQRYYASGQYLLPADDVETMRLDAQHQMLVEAHDNKLSLAPSNLQSGDRVLESAAGTGIWALQFIEENEKNGILLDVECVDISDRQFPKSHLPNRVNFSVHSVTNLPAQWSERFSYVHQRLLVVALNGSLWRKAISELFRVLLPGGWVELVEYEVQKYHFDVGPYSKKLQSLILAMYEEKGVIMDLATYLPLLLKETGFVDIRIEPRRVSIGQSGIGYRSEEWGSFCKALKLPILNGGGYGFVTKEEQYEEILRESVLEWNKSNDACKTCYTILARKPC